MDKDIHFSEKRVDESWKDNVAKDQGGRETASRDAHPKKETPTSRSSAQTSRLFLNFVTSLGIQAMMQMGEVPNPETKTKEVNLDAAREIIDLLVELKQKTEGNLSGEEKHFFDTFLPEIQLKYAQKV